MTETDNPLKILITQFSETFAAWLLDQPIQAVRPLNVEFPAQPLQSDLLFHVVDHQGQALLLHLELQGQRSHRPMPYRELEYMSRVSMREIPLPLGKDTPRLHSIVLYVGDGAGRGDTGEYTIYGPEGTVTLHWRYQPVRLWEMPAENLLQLEQPALTALIGLTRLQQPEQELPQALTQIRSVAGVNQRQRLLTALITLLPTEEVTQMVEKMLEENETVLLDTPYLRRMREIGREQGREIGLEEGRELGREEGLREAILEAVVRKFNPPASDYRQLQKQLDDIHDAETLQRILLALFDAEDVTAILTLATEIGNGNET